MVQFQLLVAPKELPISDQHAETFSTARIDIDLIHEHKAIGTRIDLTNRDTATLQYSINKGILITMGGSSSLVLENIQIEFVTIIPNAVSGLGDVSINISYLSQIQHLIKQSFPLLNITKNKSRKWYEIW